MHSHTILSPLLCYFDVPLCLQSKNGMDKKDLRIVFMGTPEIAAESLRALLDGGYNVVGVITAPDKPAGRGQKIQKSAVAVFAHENGLYLMQPPKLRDPEFIAQLAELKADIHVVLAFRMLPEIVWSMPPRGTFNLHASLLPQYRGAAPINWAVINGEKESGVTTFFLQHEIDTGDIIFQQRVPISDTDTAGDLHDRLMHAGASLICKTLDTVIAGNVPSFAQDSVAVGVLRSAPKISKEDCRIDWSATQANVFNHIRGFAPYPSAHTIFVSPDDTQVACKVYSVAKLETAVLSPGQIATDGKRFLHIGTASGDISLLDLQLAGKKRMSADALLRGFAMDCSWTAL